MAEPKKTNREGVNAVSIALHDILARYPRIQSREIETFTPVYYPIAIMEMELVEHTFEDFETVQLTVLHLISLGIASPGIIAKTLGLSVNYVQKVIHLLTGYGHLSGNGLTPLGMESLRQQKKITTTETLQKFQMDALNGTLLKLRQNILRKAMSDVENTTRIIGHLGHPECISEDILRNQLAGEKGQAYIHHQKGILHANVSDIRSVRCAQVQYAKSYMLKLTGQPLPIIFAKRYDRTKADATERFTWQPYSAHDPQVISRCGFRPDTTINSGCANEYILQLHNILTEHQQSNPPQSEEFLRAVTRVYGFDPARLLMRPEGSRIAVTISHEAVTTLRKPLFPLLREACLKNEHLHTNEYLYGRLMSLRIESPKLQLLGQLLSDPNASAQKARADKLWEDFRGYNGETPLVDAMIMALQKQ